MTCGKTLSTSLLTRIIIWLSFVNRKFCRKNALPNLIRQVAQWTWKTAAFGEVKFGQAGRLWRLKEGATDDTFVPLSGCIYCIMYGICQNMTWLKLPTVPGAFSVWHATLRAFPGPFETEMHVHKSNGKWRQTVRLQYILIDVTMFFVQNLSYVFHTGNFKIFHSSRAFLTHIWAEYIILYCGVRGIGVLTSNLFMPSPQFSIYFISNATAFHHGQVSIWRRHVRFYQILWKAGPVQIAVFLTFFWRNT